MNNNIKSYIDTSVKKVNTLAHNGYVANEGRIADLENKVALLEEAAVNDLFTTSTDSTKAVRKSIPNKALSNFYMRNLGGCPSKCSNLCDVNTINLKRSSARTYSFSQTFEIGTYTISANVNSNVSCYINISDITDRSFTGAYTFTIATSATKTILFYISSSVTDSDSNYVNLSNIIINKGSTALAYESYYSGIKLNYATSVDMYGKNVINPNAILCQSNYYVSSWATSVNPTSRTSEQMRSAFNGWFTMFFYFEKQCSVVVSGMTLRGGVYSGICDSNFNVTTTINNTNVKNTPISVPANSYLFLGANSNDFDFSLSTAQIEVGSASTSYSPYKKTTLLSSEMLQSIKTKVGADNMPLGYIDFATKKFVKTMASVDLGTLNWNYQSDNNRWLNATIKTSIVLNKSIIPAVSSNYDNVEYSAALSNNSICYYSTNGNVFVNNGSSTSKPSGTLYYELATYVETDLSDILQDVEVNEYGMVVRNAEANGSIVFNNDNNLPIPSEETYLIKSV